MKAQPYVLSAAGPAGLFVVNFEAIDDQDAMSLAVVIVREQGAGFLPQGMVEIVRPDATLMSGRMSVADMAVA